MQTINSSFLGDFKCGDNILHNLEILKVLYDYYQTLPEPKKELLHKPIIITIVSVLEAAIYDLHFKIVHFTNEGAGDISKTVLTQIRTKKIEKFEQLIACVRKHNLIHSDQIFYDKMDELRKLRNRVHIQNTKQEFERDEPQAFSMERKIEAEKLLERTLRIFEKQYHRAGSRYHDDFDLPWNHDISAE